VTDPRPAPYPADTRAKGWRFELEYERIEQSDTWGLTTLKPEARPWLLMTWYTAWKQHPCGSMPADPAVFAGLIGASDATFSKHRKILLRGWWLADDGRLYHPTITARVMEMLEYRRKTAERVAKHKAAKRDERAGNTLPTHPLGVKNNTGTGTGTNLGDTEDHHHPGGGADVADDGEFDPGEFVGSNQPTAAGVICGALRRAGIHDTNPGHPTLLALLSAGAQQVEFAGFVPAALAKSPKQPFAYLLGAVKGERERAATLTGNLHRGPMPNRQEAIEQRNAAVGDAWLAEQGAA
jgi:hypothetical protein